MSGGTNTEVFTWEGREFRFNEHVVVEMLMGVPDEKRTGRLVQVRVGVGAFGSNVYIVRLRDGSLMTFENVLIRRRDDRRFEKAFYESNGKTAPVVPDQAVYPSDSTDVGYSIKGEWEDTGFVIEKPRQPAAPARMFALTVISGGAGA